MYCWAYYVYYLCIVLCQYFMDFWGIKYEKVSKNIIKNYPYTAGNIMFIICIWYYVNIS